MEVRMSKQVSRIMADAFIAGRETPVVQNTRVEVMAGIGVTRLILHSSEIAVRFDDGSIIVTLAGWDTGITRGRLNALLTKLGAPERFHHACGEVFFGLKLIDKHDRIPVNMPVLCRMIHALEQGKPLESAL
jgi:hypothetical protein